VIQVENNNAEITAMTTVMFFGLSMIHSYDVLFSEGRSLPDDGVSKVYAVMP
jgi:hypothetical protein